MFSNNNVRKQYYDYLLEQYEEKSPLDTEKLTDYYYDMAYDGKWHGVLCQGMQLHKIIIQFEGGQLKRMDEVK